MVIKRRTRRKFLAIGAVLVLAFLIAVAGAGAWGHNFSIGCGRISAFFGWCP